MPDPTPATPAADSRFYRPELDCLRFFAFFSVFIYHTLAGDAPYYATRHVPFASLIASSVSAGRFGVDLFFLLSAYLITELLLRERERFGSLDVRSFYARRILRIWPLYFLGILIGVVLTAFDPAQHFPLSLALALVFLVGNFRIALGGALNSPMLLLWSVSFEEQFYLFWPAFIARPGIRNMRRTLVSVALALLAISELSRLLLAGYARARHSEVMIFGTTFTRLDPIACGILCAALLPRGRIVLAASRRLLALLGGALVWIAVGHYYSLSNWYLLLGYPAAALGAFLLFIAFIDSGIAPQWLRYLGKISYGLYVFHAFAAYLVLRPFHGQVHTLGAFVIYWVLTLTLTIALSAASYRFFESPFLRLKERFARVQSRPV